MAKAIAQIRLDTRMLLDEATASDWSSAQVDAAINYNYHDVVTTAMEVYENYYVTNDTLDSVADQQEYGQSDGFPTDFFKIRRVEINYDVDQTNSTPKRALPVNIDDVRFDLANTANAITVRRSPGYYLLGSGSETVLGLLPIPDNSDTDAIKIWYVRYAVDLSDSETNVDIPYADRYARLISYGAAADLLRKGQQEEGPAKQYRGEFEAGLEKMKQQLEDRRADDSKGITDTVGEDLNFDHTLNTQI